MTLYAAAAAAWRAGSGMAKYSSMRKCAK